jgi:rSAM/selenodomain-associated transferase 2
MNVGAKVATGGLFLFLHADTFLPKGAPGVILERMEEGRRVWGRFDVRLSGRHLLLRVIELLMNCRSRVTHIATGDQAIFAKREIFEATGGFSETDVMEDIALSKRLKEYSLPCCLWQRVLTSSRRWEKGGIVRTILLMWLLRGAYFFKVKPNRLAKFYRQTR